MKDRLKRYLVMVAGLALVGAACAGDSAETTTMPPATANSQSTTAAPGTTAAPATTQAPATTEAPETTTTAAAGTSADATAFQKAIETTSAVSSGRMQGSMEIIGAPDTAAPINMEFEGAFDNEQQVFNFVMDLGAIAEAAGEDASPEFAGFFEEMEILQIGDMTYMKFGFFNLLGVQTEWVSLPNDLADGALDDFGATAPSEPLDFLSTFDGNEVEVTDLGMETIRGTETTHYRIVIDVEAIQENADQETLDALDDQGAAFVDMLPLEIWIDGDDLIHRYSVEIDASDADPAEAGFEMMVMTFDLFDHGADIGVSAPNPEDVTVLDELPSLGGFTG